MQGTGIAQDGDNMTDVDKVLVADEGTNPFTKEPYGDNMTHKVVADKGTNPFTKEPSPKSSIEDRERQPRASSSSSSCSTVEPCVFNATPSIEDRSDDNTTDLDTLIVPPPPKRRKPALNWSRVWDEMAV